MKNCVWFNHLLICALMGLFIACTDEEEEGGTTDNGSVSDKEIVVKMTVEVSSNETVEIEFDGEDIDYELSRFSDKKGYTSLLFKDYETIPFPKNLTINWGDGTETNSTSHQFALRGTYVITLKCKELRILSTDAPVREMDLSQAVDLEYLCFGKGSQAAINTLDLSRNKKLKMLNTSGAEAMFIDVSNNKNLVYFDCNLRVRKDEKLDFSKNTELRYLEIWCLENDNKPSSLNIKGCNELIYLHTYNSSFSDEMANKIYNDLPKGKTWEYDNKEYSSYVNVGTRYKNFDNFEQIPIGDFSIATQKGWTNRYNDQW